MISAKSVAEVEENETASRMNGIRLGPFFAQKIAFPP